MNGWLDIRPPIAEALAAGRAVVALESSLISHGLPYPDNLETARALEEIVAGEGAVPATIGVVAGRAVVGLSPKEMELCAAAGDMSKVSRGDISVELARQQQGVLTGVWTTAPALQQGGG